MKRNKTLRKPHVGSKSGFNGGGYSGLEPIMEDRSTTDMELIANQHARHDDGGAPGQVDAGFYSMP